MGKRDWCYDAEYRTYVDDLLEKPQVQELKNYKHHHYTNRLDHSIAVSYYSYLLAKKVHANARAVARAGLLHDMYYYDNETAREVLNGENHYKVHPQIAAINAAQITDLSELEKDIIHSHMFGAIMTVPHYKESYIVTLMDKYCSIKDVSSPFWQKTKDKTKSFVQNHETTLKCKEKFDKIKKEKMKPLAKNVEGKE